MSCWYLLFWGLLLAVLKEATAEEPCAKEHIIENGKCVDDNECEYKNPICGANVTCHNTNGSYYCQCVMGYETKSQIVNFTQENGELCKDINECVKNKAICGSNATCHNVPGSYYCTCDPGFVVSNGQEQFNASQKVSCNDIDECVENQTICGPDAECRNTEGSYYCTCRSGFVASNKQEKFNPSQGVQCTGTESSGQQFNPTVPTLLPLILWILMFYQ